MFSPEEIKNLNVLISVGARVVSSETKTLQESAAIQATAVALLEKLNAPEPTKQVIGPENTQD